MMLSQKYRPRQFSDVIGQRHQVTLLRNSILQGRVAPIYLISGPWGTGKTTLARIFAMSLNCPKFMETQEPCGVCDSCQSVINDESNNYTELDAASSGNIDDVRRLREDANYASAVGGRRVITLDECHQLSKPAQNALLKLFEEGSDNVVYLLCTTEPEKLLETIKSRARPVPLKLPTNQEIYDRVVWVCEQENIPFDPRSLQKIVRASHGHVRDSLVLLDTLQVYGGVTPEAVVDVLQSDLTLDFYRILGLLADDLSQALKLLDGMTLRLAESDIYDGLAEALINSYKYWKQLEYPDDVDEQYLRLLSNRYQGDTIFMAKFLLKKKNDRLTKAQLVCDLLILEQAVTQQYDLWSLLVEGVVKPNTRIATRAGVVTDEGREVDPADKRFQDAHKKRGAAKVQTEAAQGTLIPESLFIESLQSVAYWERFISSRNV